MDKARFWKDMYYTIRDIQNSRINGLESELEKSLLLLKEGLGYRSADWYNSVYSALEEHEIKFDKNE